MRLPEQTKKGVASDVSCLTRTLARVEGDASRSARDRNDLCNHLRAALALLLKSTPGARVKKAATKS
jgi:hypothetical protein